MHITLAALVLGLAQLPFLINLAMSLWRGAPAGDNPWEATTLEWQTSRRHRIGNFAASPQVHHGAYDYSVPGGTRRISSRRASRHDATTTAVIPWTYEPRPDTRTTNVRVGMWLFLASEAMFFGVATLGLRAAASRRRDVARGRHASRPEAAASSNTVCSLATGDRERLAVAPP